MPTLQQRNLDNFISREQVANGTITEMEFFRFVTEASDLGWRAGTPLPTRIETELGNGQPFLLKSVDDRCAEYRQGNGCLSLIVFND